MCKRKISEIYSLDFKAILFFAKYSILSFTFLKVITDLEGHVFGLCRVQHF